MKSQILIAFERAGEALRQRPGIGRGTGRTVARVTEGARCEIEDGRWTLTADLSEKSGGSAAGPDPGVFGRTALATCLAMTYVRWTEKRGLPIRNLEIEIQADYDARGEHGIDGVLPGYSEVRYIVSLDTDADEAFVREVLDEADAHTPWLDVFRRPQNVKRELRINKPVEG